jgi:hypothetical protein
MSTIRSPGVYFEKFEERRPTLSIGATGQTGFLGMATRGPLHEPVAITSFDEFLDKYGAPVEGGYLANSVRGFFENGGATCYVLRVAHIFSRGRSVTASLAQKTIVDRTGKDSILIQAKNEGGWGNNIRIDISTPKPEVQTLVVRDISEGENHAQVRSGRGFQVGSQCRITDGENERFVTINKVEGKALFWQEPIDLGFKSSAPTYIEPLTMEIEAQVPGYKERFVGLNFSPSSGNYFPRLINAESQLLNVENLSSPSAFPDCLPAEIRRCMLTGGTDGLEDLNPQDFIGYNKGPGNRCGLGAFEAVEDIDLLAIPDLYAAREFSRGRGFRSDKDIEVVQDAMITHCERLKDRFAILDLPPKAGFDRALQWRMLFDSAFAAFYYPWIVIPGDGRRKRVVPPCGHIAGVIARCDAEMGVHNPPANAVIEGIVDMDVLLNDNHLSQLNQKGINCLKYSTARGIRVWGARTISSDPNWRYINVRRIFNMVRRSLEHGTQWIVFEPNGPTLWEQVSRSLRTFLEQLFLQGYFRGAVASEGFYVVCDESTNPPENIDSGILVCEIGLAPVSPAEFITFRISQQMEDRATNDSIQR